MSGWAAICARRTYARLPGCSDAQSLVCHQIAQGIVRCGAGVLAGTKPAALFSVGVGPEGCPVPPAAHDHTLPEVLLALDHGLRAHGLGLVVIWQSRTRAMLLLYRTDLVAALLAQADARELLLRAGHDVSSPRALACSFAQRLERYYALARARDAARRCLREGRTRRDAQPHQEWPAFPHEIGVLLGYPLEDVRGFLDQGVPTCRGPWLAYGDPELARRRFTMARVWEKSCRYGFEQGLTLGELAQCPPMRMP